jgi:hypothetical protein
MDRLSGSGMATGGGASSGLADTPILAFGVVRFLVAGFTFFLIAIVVSSPFVLQKRLHKDGFRLSRQK